MSERNYDWKRFWCPRSGYIDLSDRGYLVDPESEWGQHYNTNLVTLEAIADIPCLVLLGEPGIGKSQEMKNLRRYTEGTTNQTHKVLALNLQAYGSEERLVRNLFESRRFTDWINGTHRLYVFLDSLDEGLLRIETLATLLVEELGKEEYREQLSRLSLRIACRTAVFPKVLEEGLEKLWTKDNLRIYELTPLRRIDVERAVDRCGLEPAVFMDEVDRKGAAPFAIKPITLDFLVNIFQRNNGQFPANQRLADLYLQGCRVLCEEPRDKNYHPQRKPNHLEVEQRLIIAARIAAVTVFARRFAVWIEQDLGNIPDEDVLFRKLSLGSETVNVRVCPVTEHAIREVLDTGLFSSRGTNRMGWAHQTYAEFLAAWYLLQHNFNLAQVLDLIIHPDQRVVPQLQETAAWLASMMPELFREIAKTDPDVLLQSDIATATDIDKATLVESLLRAYDEDRLPYSYRFLQYQHLNHSGIASQLQAYIADSGKNDLSRLTAIDITRACNVKDVQSNLADVAIDSSQPYLIRYAATQVLGKIGDEETKAKLKPLVLGEHEDDPEDKLKGYALKAVWPKHISVEELLANISSPRSRYIGGSYQDFIARQLTEGLNIADLPATLKWLNQKFPLGYELNYPFYELSKSIMIKAWQNLDEPGVLSAFADVAMLRLQKYNSIFDSRLPVDDTPEAPLIESDEKRRKLIESIISSFSDLEEDIAYYIQPITLSEDFFWLIDRLLAEPSKQLQRVWAKLLRWKMKWKNTKHIDAIIIVRDYNSVLRTEFDLDITSIELDSERAKQAKADYLRYKKILQHRETKPLLDPPPKQRVVELLEIVEQEQPERWWQVCNELTLKPTSTHYYFPDTPDLTKLPGWAEADADTKARIIKTAELYLDSGELDVQGLLQGDNLTTDSFAGYQALYLLAKQESFLISEIPQNTWIRWMPVILKVLDIYLGETKDNDEYCQKILKAAYQADPNKFIHQLTELMIHNNYQPKRVYSYAYRLTIDSLDDSLVIPLLNKIKKSEITAGLLNVLLPDLFKCDFNAAIDWAISLITLPAIASEEGRAKALVAADALMPYLDDSSWKNVWNLIEKDIRFGREFLESVSYKVKYDGNLEQYLKEDQIADLYIFLHKHYPEQQIEKETAENVKLKGSEAWVVKPDDSVRMWKNYIPQRLQERGTPEACDALRKIIRELPEQKDKLQQRLLETEILARRKTWKPPEPEALLQFVSDQDKRLVQNGQQLLNVLIESLKRLELELQGETPAVRDLWDKVSDKTFKPVDENAFSDYVKRFLDKDLKSRGIIVNREVELRRGYGNEPGERTDIHVDAVLKRPNGETYDSITVIIEVKGCWHSEVKTAMATQLVERYLKDNVCSYGLYLIGWFSCPQWDAQDSRKKKTQKISIDEARNKFDQQAEKISLSGNVVRAYVLNTTLR
ncbi:NACHT domain-containing protein [Coleofasciculus sp.]|uniref:NACHT domain-containing protein n=1 Tax=Coleofasciculus sp. TaxID=3100458 RepID=UPI0039FB17F7